MSFSLKNLTTLLGLPAQSTDRILNRLSTLTDAGPDDVSFIIDFAYLKALGLSKAAVILAPVSLDIASFVTANTIEPIVLRVKSVEQAVEALLAHLAPPASRPSFGVHASATIAIDATLAAGVAIGANVVVGSRCVIGERTVVHPNVVLYDDVNIGPDCEIFSNVTIRERCTLGSRVIINSGAVLGTDGFGYRWDGNGHRKITHIGRVVLENDVEIGSCTTIDRGKFGDTRIGRGTKIDNQVQVAHNCTIGAHCLLVAQVGIAGSATLGSGVVVGGATAIKDHVTIGDRAMAGAMSGIHNDVAAGEIVIGAPAIPRRQYLRQHGALSKLPELRSRVQDLTRLVNKLQEKISRLEAGAHLSP